jgi:hypothetical protein
MIVVLESHMYLVFPYKSCNVGFKCLILFHIVLCYSMLFLCMLIHVHFAYHLGTLIDHGVWRTRADG